MVKFRKGDANCHVVLGKLKEICAAHEEYHAAPVRPADPRECRSLADRKIVILKNLHTSPYRDRKDRNPDRVSGTCEWFVKHELFKQWQESASSKILWASADPGCGKSVLAKYLVDHELPTTESRTTCYFFFKDDFEDQRSAKGALSCILHQLFYTRKTLFSDKIVERFETYGDRLTDSFGELWELLLTVAQDTNAGEIVCILDAFDECEDQARFQLSHALCKFFSAPSNINVILKFLITSRPVRKIRQEFQPLDIASQPVIRLRGESESEVKKITREIDVYIHTRVQDIQRLLQLEPDDADLLLAGLLRNPNRTYLWVHLTLDLIQTDTSIDHDGIGKVASLLPQTVDDAYERILERSRDFIEARKLLSIVVAATRPLTLAEMALALTLREDHRSYNNLHLNPEERFREHVRELCGLFVSIIDSRVYLLHQTAKEFLIHGRSKSDHDGRLKWKSSLRLQECHRVLWQISAWHLLFNDFETKPLNDPDKLSQYLHDHVFLDYSAKGWALHFRLSCTADDAAVTDSLFGICDTNSGRCLTWFRVYWANARGDFPEGFTTLMLASYFGIVSVVRKLLQEDGVEANSRDHRYGRSALSWASENGFGDVVKLLLKGPRTRLKHLARLSIHRSAKTEARDIYSRTPLSYAALNGHSAVVQLLVKAGARADLEDINGVTPISYAICSGKEEVASWLWKEGSIAHSADNIIRRLLRSAAKNGDEVIIRRVLSMDKVDADTKDGYGRTPLSWAASMGHEAVIRLLLGTGKVDVNVKDNFDRTPLSWAASMGHEAVIQLLLDTGKVDVDVKDNDGRTPLIMAASRGHKAIIQLLLGTGKVDVDAKDITGRTPLSWASHRGYKDIVKLLENSH